MADRVNSMFQSNSGGKPLDPQLRKKLEGAFGEDFSQVRVEQASQPMPAGARAYTQGNSIAFAPGAYQPHTKSGMTALAHELAHVVQQREGRVKPGQSSAVDDFKAKQLAEEALKKL